MPALFIRKSIFYVFIFVENYFMLLVSAKSKWNCSIFILPLIFFILSTAFFDFYTSLAPIIIWHPCLAISRVVASPIPVFPPVIIATEFYRLGLLPVNWLPRKYLLITKRNMAIDIISTIIRFLCNKSTVYKQ